MEKNIFKQNQIDVTELFQNKKKRIKNRFYLKIIDIKIEINLKLQQHNNITGKNNS